MLYVSVGVLVYALGIYEPLFDIFGAGVSVPLVGFGAGIGKGVREAIDAEGALGILKGGLSATSTGITASLVCGAICAFLSKPKSKRM